MRAEEEKNEKTQNQQYCVRQKSILFVWLPWTLLNSRVAKLYIIEQTPQRRGGHNDTMPAEPSLLCNSGQELQIGAGALISL